MYTLEETHMTQFVVYSSDDEIIVSTEEDEPQMLELFADRDFDNEYDRRIMNDPGISITPHLRYE